MSNPTMTPGGPGWNDPPKLSYETHSQTTARRNQLTKRVGLPDLKIPEKSTNETIHGGTAPPNGPPPMASLPPQKEPSKEDTPPSENSILPPQTEPKEVQTTIFNPLGDSENENAKENEKKEKADEEKTEEMAIKLKDVDIVKELENIVTKCEESNIFSNQVSGMINKKLTILGEQIETEKLPQNVKEKMVELTKFLMRKKYDDAWNVHVSLMCDHSSLVIQWMVGVKKLISEAKKLK